MRRLMKRADSSKLHVLQELRERIQGLGPEARAKLWNLLIV